MPDIQIGAKEALGADQIRDYVTEAYRWILGREPDRAGLETYCELFRCGDINRTRLREILISSDEFRQGNWGIVSKQAMRNTISADIVFFQTADAGFYKSLLEVTSQAIVKYCEMNVFSYQSFIGMKRGFHPWQASFNRYYLFMDLVRAGFKGWAVYMDADAWVHDLSFDLRAYLGRYGDRAGVLTPVAPHLPQTDVNNGVMMLNLADSRAVATVERCLERYEAVDDNTLIDLENWPGDINDQMFLCQTLQESDELRLAFHYESNSLMNERDASFIRTLLRLHYPAREDRLVAIRRSVDGVLGERDEVGDMGLYPGVMSAIYRGMLGREPDEGGLRHFRSRFEQLGIERALLETIHETTLSREFAERHGLLPKAEV